VYGLNGPHFFGIGIPEVRLAMEMSKNAPSLVVPLTAKSVPYSFCYRLPTDAEVTAVQRRRAALMAEKELVSSSGCARVDGQGAVEKSKGAGRITRALVINSEEEVGGGGGGTGEGGRGGGGRGGAGGGGTRNARTQIGGGEDQARSVQANHETNYRRLKSVPLEQRLLPMRSHIHGWGLFTKVDLKKDDMIVEYAGELLRNAVADRREAAYESKGVGSYVHPDPTRPDQTPTLSHTLARSLARAHAGATCSASTPPRSWTRRSTAAWRAS
jgi:hypothetical protein